MHKDLLPPESCRSGTKRQYIHTSTRLLARLYDDLPLAPPLAAGWIWIKLDATPPRGNNGDEPSLRATGTWEWADGR